MPKLKQIDCFIELGPSSTRLQEYGARYSDGHVESFICVPDIEAPLTIHLRSDGYIAPGLAFFVYMDGEYQCNRNRINLKLPGDGVRKDEYETEFRVRQKEEKTSFGTFVVRDWSFAKLNRVAADKAPNLNPQFTNNVGTIEVIVLRCKTGLDDMPPPKAKHDQTKSAEQKPSGTAKRKSKAAAPTKASSVQQSDMGLGGMFGLFDGACDYINLDGTQDQFVVGSNDRVKMQSVKPPPDMEWDGTAGKFNYRREFRPTMNMGDGFDEEHETEHEASSSKRRKQGAAQFDGYGDQPAVVVNQWGNRGRDDMRGDRYLGLQHSDRKTYKQYLRETGETVSTQPPGYMPAQPAANITVPSEMPAQPNMRLIAEDLGDISRCIQEYIQNNTGGNLSDANRDLKMVKRLQYLQQQSQGSVVQFPFWLREYLTDIETVRQYILQLQLNYPQLNVSQLVNYVATSQKQALTDPLYHKWYRDDVLDNMLVLQLMLNERVEMMRGVAGKATQFPRASADKLHARINFVAMQHARAKGLVERLEQQTGAMPDQRQGPSGTMREPAPFEQRFQVGGDGAYNYPGPKNANGHMNQGTPGGNTNGWQDMGTGTWNTGYQRPKKQTEPTNWPAYEGGQQTPAWDNSKQQQAWSTQGPPQGNAQQNGYRQSDDKKCENKGNGGGSNHGWKSVHPQRTHEHNFSHSKNQNDGQRASSPESSSTSQSQRGHFSDKDNNKRDHSQRGSHKQVDDWANKGDNQQQADNNNAWNNSDNNNDATKDGWGGDIQQKGAFRSARSSVAKGHDGHSEVLVKPYWKDWNQPFNRYSSSEEGSKTKYIEPRDVYNYPASTLPAVPAEGVKDASHGVQIGRGTDYSHKCHKPIYLDTMENPYAVFNFKYRSKEALERILKIKINEVDAKKIQEQVEKGRLESMPKHKLVEELMQKRAPQKSDSKNGSTRGATKVEPGWENQGDDKGASKDAWVAEGNGGNNEKSGASANGGSWPQQSSHSRSSHKGSSKSKEKANGNWNNAPASKGGSFAGW